MVLPIAVLARRPSFAAVLFAVVALTGCSAPQVSPTQSAPSPLPAGVTAVTIGGLPSSPRVGDSAQLTASATLSDGAQKVITDAAWKFSDATVADVSSSGVLIIKGTGEGDVTASFQTVSASMHIIVKTRLPVSITYDITGTVREAAPTEDVPVAGAAVVVHFVGCPTCPQDNQSATTDTTGRFTLHGITTPGFTLWATKSGYDPASYDVVSLPRDQFPNIGLTPLREQVTLHIRGQNVCTERPRDPFYANGHGRTMARLAVYHDGTAHFGVPSSSPFDIGSGADVYRISPTGQPIWSSFNVHTGEWNLQAGYIYFLAMVGDVELCPFDYDVTFLYPR